MIRHDCYLLCCGSCPAVEPVERTSKLFDRKPEPNTTLISDTTY